MFRVALISIYDEGNYGSRMVSANLKRNGFEVCNIFGDLIVQQLTELSKPQLGALDGVLRQFKPDLIGFSIISAFSLPFAIQICNHIRSYSDAPLIFGGAHPSLTPELTLRQSPIDYDTHQVFGECVWEEICKFDIKKMLKKGKYKIGLIFGQRDRDAPAG